MFNIIKADLYRIFRGKGVYITLILFIALLALQVATNTVGTVGMYVKEENEIDQREERDETEFVNKDELEEKPEVALNSALDAQTFTGSIAAFKTMESTDSLLYFMLAFIIFIGATDFSTGCAKNVLSSGVSKSKYYISKLILAIAFLILISLINVIVPIIIGTIVHGFEGTFDITFIIKVLKVFLPQLYLCTAAVCVGMFFVFVTKRTAIVNGLFIAFNIVPKLVIFLLSYLNLKFLKLLDYEIVTNIRMFSNVEMLSSSAITKGLLVATVYILISTIGGFIIFKRSEIK